MKTFLPVFVRNESAPPARTNTFQRLTMNFVPGTKTRVETLEDRPHTVIPMVMMVEGVHEGSKGKIYYSPTELGKTPEVWNHKPIVVYHPELNGEGISACEQTVVNTRKVGVIMNTKFDSKNNRLTSEAWLEESRANKVDPRIFEAVTGNKMMEVSTGVFVDMEVKAGKWGEEEYAGVAYNLRADHLAILPDMVGACSIKDGAGLLRNSRPADKTQFEAWAGLKALLKTAGLGGMIRNDMSFDNIRQSLCRAIQERLKLKDNELYNVWVEDVYSNFFIYSYEGKLYQLSYEASDTGVTLGSENPSEVARVTEYRSVSGAKFVGNKDQTQSENMNKTAVIAAILAANVGWSDQKVLEGLSDKQLEAIHNGIPKPATPPTVNTKKELVDSIILKNDYGWGESDRPALMAFNDQQLAKMKLTAPAPAAPAASTATTTNQNQPANILTWEQIMASAPPEVRGALAGVVATNANEKSGFVEKLVANTSLGYTKPELEALSVDVLRKMARNADAQIPTPFFAQNNYAGMAPTTPIGGGSPKEQEPLMTPVINFRKEQPAAAAAKA